MPLSKIDNNSLASPVTAATVTTLTTTTLSDGTNSTSSTNCIQGSAKAWVNFSGVTGTITSSYNVGSITKNGTGNYQINFTNAFVDTNYAAVGMAGQIAAGGTALGVVGKRYDSPTQTTTVFGIYTLASTTAVTTDYPYVTVAVFR